MHVDPDYAWLSMALAASQMSRDPSTRVGSVIVRDGRLLSTGWNCFPRGIVVDERMQDREAKLKIVVHAEVHAIIHARQDVTGATLYTACHGVDGLWGGPPCTRCAVHCIEAGITEVVSYPAKTVPSRWAADLEYAEALLAEADVCFRTLPIR